MRNFLHFSESAALRVGLTSQQHQLLLQIAGAAPDTALTVGYLASRLVLRHHSVVELCNRCEEAGLIARERNPQNRRMVVLKLTEAGREVLRELSIDHSRELNQLAPQLIRSLEMLSNAAHCRTSEEEERNSGNPRCDA
ncbi:MarR family winged helix-turn-helix transcriptional regulator [Edaphobacter albus]|uniref:MarR family winged helix-turn-helix transcriptional regulator n=1 Tax=Edaphobacter sp. 4G125 TaxID=2763071 RepID=UPI0016441101|nr:MarR family transcriptional regulator [Edaphobacter sp. 4G125]QNI35991.1 MarR family transcriptional regulator [Edaphobacter sp. 4G125]